MADLVFLLLIFFMLTSTLVSPNAIKLLLPSSQSDRTLAPAKVLTVYIDENVKYYVGQNFVIPEDLEDLIARELLSSNDATVELRADASVPVQNVVFVIDVVNNINKQFDTQHKVILATKPL